MLDILILKPAPAIDLTAVTVSALFDTGASSSGVSSDLAGKLGLPSIGKQPIHTAGGTVASERYLFRVGLPIEGGFPFIFDDIVGFELTGDSVYQAVLGMDVLSCCDFVMSRDGRCELSFD